MTDPQRPAPLAYGKLAAFPEGWGGVWRYVAIFGITGLLLGIALWVTSAALGGLEQAVYPADDALSIGPFLFMGALYAMIGAILRLQGHNKWDPHADYWGKHFGLAGATVAFVGVGLNLSPWTGPLVKGWVLGAAVFLLFSLSLGLVVRAIYVRWHPEVVVTEEAPPNDPAGAV